MLQPAIAYEDLPHYTYDDYKHWEGKWEVIHGIPYAMTPSPKVNHQRISKLISYQLGQLLQNCPRCEDFLPLDWQISEDTIVQPDNMIICDMNPEENKITVPPVVVFEILSPSTARKDKILKYRLYREAGVKYYCIVAPESKSADVFTLNDADEFDKTDNPDGKMTFDLGPCKIDFDFSKLFNY